ncbi:MAG: type II toxin-antitoxin system prevent-host-death family antitoxin [Rhodospirillales bacterium]|nr:type II toxin-antitoxin system prevent-host-death family antitoxin [Rhodospirillales bacterium]
MSLREIQASEAGTHFPELLDEVERGETVVITREGRPVARLVPERAPQQPRNQAEVLAAIAAIKALRRDMPKVSAAELREWINEGRKY